MSFLKNIFSGDKTPLLNERSYEELFRKYYAPLCKLIFRIVKDKALAEDIVQEVFVKLWEKRAEYKIETSLKSYIYRAAMNASYNHLEKLNRYPKLSIEDTSLELVDDLSIENQLQAKELELKIEHALTKLPTACKEVFLLSRYEGFSYKEIAETLGISIKTVENQMGKALRIFREQLFNDN